MPQEFFGLWEWKFWDCLCTVEAELICLKACASTLQYTSVLFRTVKVYCSGFWNFIFCKLILFLGWQSKHSTEQIRNTAVKNNGAGEKSQNTDDAPPEQNMLYDHSVTPDIGLWRHPPLLEEKLDSKICSFFQRCWLPVVSEIKQPKKTNNLEELLL